MTWFLLFRHCLSPPHAVSPSGNLHTQYQPPTRKCSMQRWQTALLEQTSWTHHPHTRTHCPHLCAFTCAQPHSLTFSCIQLQPFIVWPGCHVTTAISLAVLPCLTKSRSHASAYIITRHSAISQLNGVGCTGMGIHIDSCWCWWQIFQIFHFHFHCFKLLHHRQSYFLGCRVLVRLTSHCDSLILVRRGVLSWALHGKGRYHYVNNVNNE